MTAPAVRFEAADPESPPARDLIEAMIAEMQDLYGIEGHIGVPLELSELAPPHGVYLVGRTGDPDKTPVAGGGLRTIGPGPGLGEIKRMYVVPDWRGRGIGEQLLSALEAAAVGLGMSRVRLDTGSRQSSALHLYRKSGYEPVSNYNGNDHASFWGEKRLTY